MKPPLYSPERRGLFCACGAQLNTRPVCKSYSSAGGHFRTRHCPDCRAEIETIETVVGITSDHIDITGISPDQKRLVIGMIRQFRETNVIIDMPMKPAVKQLRG